MFKVADVQVSNQKLSERYEKSVVMTVKERFESLLNTGIESWSEITDGEFVNPDLYGSWPALIAATQISFNLHYPLILDPDSIWVTIESGISKHVNLNAEALRKQFVNFAGKQTLEIFRDHFVKDDPNNDWAGCFGEFSDKISEHIGDKRDWLVSNFSTTTPLKKAVSEVILMDAMSSYFDYQCTTCCGIPSVKIEGTVGDWRNIKERIEKLHTIGLDWWQKELLPIINEIIQAKIGSPDVSFWKSFYNEGGGSGGPFVNGHVLKFYPYDTHDKQMNWARYGITSSSLKTNISKVPFIWLYYGQKIDMDFVAGLIGVQQDEDLSVRPAFGWAVRENAEGISRMEISELKKNMVVYDQKGNKGTIQDCIVDYGVSSDDKEWQKLVYLEIKWGNKLRKHYEQDWMSHNDPGSGTLRGLYTKRQIEL